jgi:hypothetical protein
MRKMTETAFEAAFKRAGFSGAEAQLYSLACQMVAKAKLDLRQCHLMIDRAWNDMKPKSLPGGGHIADEAQTANASSGEYDRIGHNVVDNHSLDAHPVVPIPAAKSNLVAVKGFLRSKPGLARGADAIGAIQNIMAKAIVFRLSDGRDIMDAQFHELAKIERRGVKSARVFTREAMVARYLLAHVTYANPDPHAKVGDYFEPKTIELAVAEAEKEASHAA